MAFGFGIHYCLGNMAKLQTRITLENALLAPHMELVDSSHIQFGENLSFRAPVAVPVLNEVLIHGEHSIH